jgi:hypothetical protein
MVIKYLNFAHEEYHQKIPVTDAASSLLVEIGVEGVPELERELLDRYRRMERL